MSGQPILATTIEMALGVNVGSLIDFETTGVPGMHPEHEIVTLGSLVRDKLHIIQRKSRNKEPFYGEVRRIVRELPRPIYSYNTDFEKSIIITEPGIRAKDSEFVDLMNQWREKASKSGIKWPAEVRGTHLRAGGPLQGEEDHRHGCSCPLEGVS